MRSVLLCHHLKDLHLKQEECQEGQAALQLRVDLFPPKELLKMPLPLLHQLLADPPCAVHSQHVRDDGDDGPGPLGMETPDKPLEVGIVAADG